MKIMNHVVSRSRRQAKQTSTKFHHTEVRYKRHTPQADKWHAASVCKRDTYRAAYISRRVCVCE